MDPATQIDIFLVGPARLVAILGLALLVAILGLGMR